MTTAGPQIRLFPAPRTLAREAADDVLVWAEEALAARGRFTLALSGGRTPRALYEMLAKAGPAALPYDRLDVFWSDERAVPPDHRDSNYRLAWEVWLSHCLISMHQVHRIRGEEDPEQEAIRYEQEIRAVLGDPPRFDIIFLGMGADGHTASLLPGAPPPPPGRLVVSAVAPVAPRRRVTFTPALIDLARRVLVLVTGSDKTEAVRRALTEPPSAEIPASLLRGPQVIWFLDAAAAAGLPRAAPEL